MNIFKVLRRGILERLRFIFESCEQSRQNTRSVGKTDGIELTDELSRKATVSL